jgi:hypothetical protein
MLYPPPPGRNVGWAAAAGFSRLFLTQQKTGTFAEGTTAVLAVKLLDVNALNFAKTNIVTTPVVKLGGAC